MLDFIVIHTCQIGEKNKLSKFKPAKKKYGGGVLLELSHELDYLQFLFNDIKKIYTASIKKFSNLITDAEDFALITGKTKK